MVIHYPAKSNCHSHGGSGNMLLVVEEQDSTCSLSSDMAFFSEAHGISCSHTHEILD